VYKQRDPALGRFGYGERGAPGKRGAADSDARGSCVGTGVPAGTIAVIAVGLGVSAGHYKLVPRS